MTFFFFFFFFGISLSTMLAAPVLKDMASIDSIEDSPEECGSVWYGSNIEVRI